MNKQPVVYFQTDARWKNKPYATKGENTTIGHSGCGPTCAAMLIQTLTKKIFTPEDACNWSMRHGYKAYNQGTYYSYFVPQFKEFNIKCDRINYTNLYGNPNSSYHKIAFDYLKKGYYLIACMGPGLWTSSGHFVVVWWEDGKVKINDPISSAANKVNGDLWTFKSQVKYYWWIDAQDYNNKEEEEVIDKEAEYKRFKEYMTQYRQELSKIAPSDFAQKSLVKLQNENITDGSRPRDFATREELITLLDRILDYIDYNY